MDESPAVRPFRPSEWRIYRDLRLRALTDSPEAFASTLGAEQAGQDRQWAESLAAAAVSGLDLPLVAFAGNTPSGLAWAQADAADPATVRLFQVWVAPEQRGRGLGRGLLGAALQWACDRGAEFLRLGVTCGDTSAMRLYLSAGFQPVGAPRPLRPGSRLQAQDLRLKLNPPGA
jgi:GNAT superfamily N-acetyltransferase